MAYIIVPGNYTYKQTIEVSEVPRLALTLNPRCAQYVIPSAVLKMVFIIASFSLFRETNRTSLEYNITGIRHNAYN